MRDLGVTYFADVCRGENLCRQFVIYAQPWQPNGPDLLILTAFGILFAVIASFLHNYAMGRTRAMHVSILGKSEPVFATIYAFLFLKELPTVQAIIGGASIIGDSVWLTMHSHNGGQNTPGSD